MPKIINVDKDIILNITRELIEKKQYDDINCRKIAKLAGIGVGTLYKFFDSKTSIMAFAILDDWQKYMSNIPNNTNMLEGIKIVYGRVYDFSKKYHELWEYEKKMSNEYMAYLTKRSKITAQISGILNDIACSNKLDLLEIEISFIAENILRYASNLYEFEGLEFIFRKLIGGKNNG